MPSRYVTWGGAGGISAGRAGCGITEGGAGGPMGAGVGVGAAAGALASTGFFFGAGFCWAWAAAWGRVLGARGARTARWAEACPTPLDAGPWFDCCPEAATPVL